MSKQELVFLGAKRTAFGTFGGTLRDVNPSDMGAVAAKAALTQAGVDAKNVDHVVVGNVIQSTADAIYVARHIGLKTGVPQEVPALGVNRLCGSGFQAVIEAAQQMATQDT